MLRVADYELETNRDWGLRKGEYWKKGMVENWNNGMMINWKDGRKRVQYELITGCFLSECNFSIPDLTKSRRYPLNLAHGFSIVYLFSTLRALITL
jgi:hypothetical protein